MKLDSLPRIYRALIVIACTCLAGVVYGIMLDSLTANLCPKYFISEHCHPGHYRTMEDFGFSHKTVRTTEKTARATDIGQDNIIDASYPVIVLFWGFVATVPASLVIGIIFAIILYSGKTPTLSMKSVFIMLGSMIPIVFVLSRFFANIDTSIRSRAHREYCGDHYNFVGSFHNTSYTVAFAYAIVLCFIIGIARIRHIREEPTTLIFG